ncbi:unnamed protein product [Porites evermanni]|uniref:Uncharacterized protein n=1 Tax=Porites evermanni TaxID=104178 RepID=A0ABN8LHQ2_9CNID|nr:unnamed protein product [Porites evermanni]
MPTSRFAAFFFLVVFQGLHHVACGQIDTVDYIAIGSSLGLAVLILAVLGYFLWRAQKRSDMGANKEMGQDNPSITETGSVSMMPLPSYNSPSLTETGRASLENPANINKAWELGPGNEDQGSGTSTSTRNGKIRNLEQT